MGNVDGRVYDTLQIFDHEMSFEFVFTFCKFDISALPIQQTFLEKHN